MTSSQEKPQMNSPACHHGFRCGIVGLLLIFSTSTQSLAQEKPASPSPSSPLVSPITKVPDLTSRENFSAAMQIVILLTVLSLAPAILLMMTSFTRIVIVLALLRQALGTQQLPPNQVLSVWRCS